MSLELVDRVVRAGEPAYKRLNIAAAAWQAIEWSWKAGREENLYGQFDLSYGGGGPPRLLEYNADTPTALFEAAVVQWDWLEAIWPGRDQFNSVHERLIEAWKQFDTGRNTVYFSGVRDHAEDSARPRRHSSRRTGPERSAAFPTRPMRTPIRSRSRNRGRNRAT